MQDDGVASRPAVQGEDERRGCFLVGCWPWGVSISNEGQGLLRARG